RFLKISCLSLPQAMASFTKTMTATIDERRPPSAPLHCYPEQRRRTAKAASTSASTGRSIRYRALLKEGAWATTRSARFTVKTVRKEQDWDRISLPPPGEFEGPARPYFFKPSAQFSTTVNGAGRPLLGPALIVYQHFIASMQVDRYQ